MNDCPRFGKWLRGCRFDGRYDTVDGPASASVEQISALYRALVLSDDMVRAIAALAGSQTTYVCDVCLRCGKTVERPALSPHEGKSDG